MIRALIFDCFGVLYSDGKKYVEARCAPEKLDELKSLYHQSDYGYISRADFVRSVTELVGINEADFVEIEKSQYVRNQPLVEFIRKQKSHYKTGLLSNVGEAFFESLFTAEEQEQLFDTVVLSNSVGVTKPSRAIYEIAAQQLGVLPEECIFIDDIPVNVEGANAAGMTGILFTTNHELDIDLRELLENTNA
jgi:putative hydrolase of the HAD superfamily